MPRPSGWHRKNRSSPASRQRATEYASRTYREQHARDKALVASGRAVCWRCRLPIPPSARCGPDWHSGHDDHDRRILKGPEHARCNLTAAASKGARTVNARRYGPRQVIRRRLLG